MRKIIPYLVLTLCFSEVLIAQQYPFRTYSIEDGLSESVVHAVIQDREGYLWLGTGFGLNRFDGIEFENYFDDQGLNNTKIQSLYEDSKGRIWIGSQAGVNYWESDSIYYKPELSELDNMVVISIFEDSRGDLWFGTDGNGVWLLAEDDELFQYSTSQGMSNNRVRKILEDDEGTIWFATRGGLTQLKNGNIRTYTTEDGLPENRIRDIVLDEQGVLWIGTREGLSRMQNGTIFTYGEDRGLLNVRIQTLIFDNENRLWLGTEGGVSLLQEDGTFKNFTIANGLSNNIIYSTTKDQEGNLWFGTFGGGVNLFMGDYFENYTIADGLMNDVVTSITQDKENNIWIGTYGGGISKYDWEGFTTHTMNQGLLDDKVFNLFTDSQERIWVGMRNGMARFDGEKLKIFSENEFPYRKIRQVFEDSRGDFWISTYDDGMVRYDGNRFELINTERGLADNTVLGAVEGNDGSIWIATYGGVSNFKDGEITNYTLQEGLPNTAVMTVLIDNAGVVWASTFGGIAWFDGQRFQSITTEDGLPNRVCYFITQSDDGSYWIGTNSGVVKFDADKYFSEDPSLKDEAFQVITREQGLVSDEMNLGAVFEDNEGHLWFGTVEGVSHFDPAKYKGNPVSPEVKIDQIVASGRSYPFRKEFRLSYDQNFVEINYSGINFTAPNQVVYEYKMEGVDPVWQRTIERSVRYPSLPSGEYVFKIHARNTNGAWSDEITTTTFIVKPPYWMQWWFLLLVLIVVLSIILLFYNYYRVTKLVDIERIRVRIASDLHDDVGASLTEIALQSDFLQASNVDSEFRKSLNQIGMQCRKIVTSLDDIVWSIDARNDTVGDLTDRMQDYIINVLGPRNFQVEYNFEDLKMNNKLAVRLKENLYLIFKEAVNNISKYSNGDEVNIRMSVENGVFEFRIHDNGTSNNGVKKTGHGLRNMEMRAKRIGASIDVNTENGFTITVTGKLN